jgi:Zn-dependent protease with chaperone function
VREFSGLFFDGKKAGGQAVLVRWDEATKTLSLLSSAGEVRHTAEVDGWKLEPALGSLPRRILLADGGVIEVPRGELPAELTATARTDGLMQNVRRLEASSWGWAAALLGVVATIALFYFFALPWAARHVAAQLPEKLTARISREVLELFDGKMFDPSELPPERQDGLRESFASLAASAGDPTPYEIIFRSSRMGPNTFALPGGQILLTDELVEMTESDDEIHLILAHELGHIHHQHGLRTVLQSAGLVLAAAFFLGDMSSVVQVAGAVPVMLVESGYSRNFEHEADEYAARFGVATGLGVQPLIDFFHRLEREYGDDPLPWISTHPGTRDRIQRLQRWQE